MMMQDLLKRWHSLARPSVPRRRCCADLDYPDAARLLALAEMFPGVAEEEIMADLLQFALQELEASLPYVHGSRQTGEDEFGDPIYEDAGPTPRYLALTRKHLQLLQHEQPAAGSGWSPSHHRSAGRV